MADLVHALRDAFPEARPGRSSAVCDGYAAGLAYRLEEVTCPDCLRAIAEWGQQQAQAACGAAFDLGQLYERAAEAVTEFQDFTGHASGYDATRHALHRLGRALSAMTGGGYRVRDPLWWRLVYLDSLEHAGFRTGADDQVRKLLPGQPAWERASGPTLAEEVERLRYARDELREVFGAFNACSNGDCGQPVEEDGAPTGYVKTCGNCTRALLAVAP